MRAWKQNSTARTYFLYDGINPVVEIDSSGSVTATNTFGANGLVSRQAGSASIYYNFDAEGNVSQRSDSSGSILSNYVFAAHGIILSGTLSEPFGYKAQAGYYTDTETGLQLLTHRFYDPNTGRFLTRDPISYEGGINLYAYTTSNPVNAVDPLGLQKGPQNPTPNPDQLKKDFYKLYQKKLTPCVWQVFSTDLDGQQMNTAQVMERQTLRNAPNVDLNQSFAQMGAQGYINDKTDPTNGRYGTIHIASGLPSWTTTKGQTISVQENYFRVYAHELGNLLSARHTGDGNTHGTRAGIVGAVSGNILDYDTGARLESCIFGNAAH